MNICVYGASSNAIDPLYIREAERLGGLLAARGYGLVFGGGASGVMGAVARGAYAGKAEKILGVAPTFFNVDGILFEHCTKLFPTETMRERKQMLEDLSDGYIIAPGGIGTFDEFFEILTLKQLGRHNKPIVLWNLGGCYAPIIDLLQKTVDNNFMPEESLSLLKVVETAEEAIAYIETYDDPARPVSFFKKING